MKKTKKIVGLALALAVTFATTFSAVANITVVPVALPNEGNFPQTDHTGESWRQATDNFKISMSNDVEGFEAVGDPFLKEGRGAYVPLPVKDGVTLAPFGALVTSKGFYSWNGKVVSEDGGAYGTVEFIEYGGRVHFSVHITAPEGHYFTFAGVKFHVKSPDGYFDEFIVIPLVSNSTRVLVGIDGVRYNDPSITGLGNKPLREMWYIGPGIGLEAFGEGSNQQKINNTLAYLIQSRFALTWATTVPVFKVSDNTPGTTMTDIITVSLGDCPSETQLAKARAKMRFKKVGDEARFIIQSHKLAVYRIMRTVNEPSTLEEFLTSYTIPESGAIIFATEHPNAEIRWPQGATGEERYFHLQSASLCDPISRISGGRVIRDREEDLTQEQILDEYHQLDLKGALPEKAVLVP